MHASAAWLHARVALVANRYTDESSRYRTSQYNRTFIPLSVSLWKDLDPVFDGVGLEGFKSMFNAFYWPKLLAHSFVYFWFSLSLLSIYGLVLGSSGWQGVNRFLALPCIADLFLIIMIIIINSMKVGRGIAFSHICVTLICWQIYGTAYWLFIYNGIRMITFKYKCTNNCINFFFSFK